MKETADTTFTEIDKLAFISIKDKKILSSRTRGRNVWYIPGGKREQGENDIEALEREIKEELNIALILPSMRYLGVYKAQADSYKPGVVVKMTCYTGEYEGEPKPAAEIEEIKYLGYSDKEKSSPVDQIIFDALHQAGVIA